MKTVDYPGILQASDLFSIKSQRRYINSVRFNLFSSIVAAALSVYNFQSPTPKLGAYIVAGALLLASLILSFVVKQLNYEDYWYQGRALAESIKTLSWRYTTCSESFESNLNESEVKSRFISTITALEKEFPNLSSVMDAEIASLPPITSTMNQIRLSNWKLRLDYYLENRINEQKNWYTKKEKTNRLMSNIWFWVSLVSQFFAIICSVVLIVCPTTNWNLVGLFTTVSASILAWAELKQYQPLKQAYTTAAIELSQIESLGANINSEADFIKYVLDSENAISREHTMWMAQRRK